MMAPTIPSNEPTSNALSIRLLGNFEIHVDGTAIEKLSYEKGRALLAYLAAQTGWHTREKLAGLLWPGLQREAARNNLRLVLLNLRRSIQDSAGTNSIFRANRHALCIRPDALVWFDVARFAAAPTTCTSPTPHRCDECAAQMEQAVELYRGDFLEGFFLPGCSEFEDWLLVRREEMRRHALDLLDRLANRFEQAGLHARALPHALRAVELDPWNEAGYRRTMRLYAALGQASAAVGQYEACRRALNDGMGTLPGEETRRLAELLRETESAPKAGAAFNSVAAPANTSVLSEWRTVTVVYCRAMPAMLVVSNQTIMALDRIKIRCAEIFQRFGGHVVFPYIGGVFAYFGYSQATENAAYEAVHATLAVLKEASEDDHEIRAGIHTGLVAASMDRTMPDASGLTSSVAVTLYTAARRSETVVSIDTYRLIASDFDCRPAGAREIPGISGPVDLFVVEKKRRAVSDRRRMRSRIERP